MATSDTDLLESTMAKTGHLIAGVRGEQLHLPTPCPEFSVGQLINHLVGWAAEFANRVNSLNSPAEPNAYIAGAEPAAEFALSASLIVSAYRAELQGAQKLPIGILLMEYVTHGWDLATSLGRPSPFTDDEAEAGLVAGMAMLKPESRGPGKSFGEEVPAAPEDSAVQRLVAFLGRDPHWAA